MEQVAWLQPVEQPSADDEAVAEPATPRGRTTRAALLDAARAVLARDGYAESRIVDITDTAGKSVGVFYNYFADKEELLQALAEDFRRDAYARHAAIDPTGLSTYEAIVEVVRVYWETCRDHAGVLAGVFQAAMSDPRFAAFWRELRGTPRRHIAASVEALQADGYAPTLHPEATASALGSMLDYFCYVWHVEGGEQGMRAIDDEVAIETLASIWYHAVSWKARSRR